MSSRGIVSTYEGASMLIFGGIGTVGKILLEKILRSCPGVKRVYIVIRQQRGLTAAERLKAAFETELFTKLLSTDPDAMTKCIAIPGDMCQPNLGISDEDQAILVENVSIVFNLPPMYTSMPVFTSDMIRDNVESVQKLMTMCRKMKHLKALVHASTAFCHNDKPHVKEMIYPTHTGMPVADILAMAHLLDDNSMEKIKKDIMDSTSNEYMFTKSAAETLIATEGGTLPVCIVRIPNVGATLHDPFPGWIDGFGSIGGTAIAIGYGVLRHVYGDGKYILELLPADMVVSCLIAAAWNTSLSQTQECTVYNLTTYAENRALSIIGVATLMVEFTKKTPFSRCIREPRFTMVQNKTYVRLNNMINVMLPAYIIDAVSIIMGKPAKAVRRHRRIIEMYYMIGDLLQKSTTFDNGNVDDLWQLLSSEEKQVFDFDMKKIDWRAYVEQHCLGVKRHVVKDDMSKIPEARLFLQRWCLFWNVLYWFVAPVLLVGLLAVFMV